MLTHSHGQVWLVCDCGALGTALEGSVQEPIWPFRASYLHSLVQSSAEGSSKQYKGKARR